MSQVDARRPLRHGPIGVLGVLTIVSYGSWYYAFGVLLDPIRIDTGWSESLLAATFSIGIALVGLTSASGGLLLDRLGTRPVFLIAGAGGSFGLAVASFARHPLVFLAGSAVAMVSLGALGFYHITMTAAVRVNTGGASSSAEAGNPGRAVDDVAEATTERAMATRAISTLTIWGAFASAIYLPGTAALVERLDWRDTIRVLAALVLAMFLVGAVLIDVAPAKATGPPPSLGRLLRSAVGERRRRALTAAIALGGVAMSTVLVYQVPAMTAAGLPLATAAALAGVRGVAQTLGRVPLAPLVARIGSTGAMVLAFVSLAVGGAVLMVAGSVPLGLAFAAFAGFGIGAFSPLQGIKTEELYDRETLGGAMGFNSSVLMVAGALGPVLAGALADVGDDRRVVGPIIVVSALGAAVAARGLRDQPTGADDCNT